MPQKQSAPIYRPNKLERESREMRKHLPGPVFLPGFSSIARSALTGRQEYGEATPHEARRPEMTPQSNMHEIVLHREGQPAAVWPNGTYRAPRARAAQQNFK